MSEENETTVKAILAAAEKRAVAAGATAQQGRQMAQLQAVATFLGFNELAKLATSLGERVYYRMCRETAKEHAELMGAELGYDDNAPGERIVMVLPGYNPTVSFREKDIEEMRAAVSAWDAGRAQPSVEGAPWADVAKARGAGGSETKTRPEATQAPANGIHADPPTAETVAKLQADLAIRDWQLAAALAELAEAKAGILLPGWSCAGCQSFNGSMMGERADCRSCGKLKGANR
jgi:hypothetical protein